MSNAITIKQGKPSAPGTVVDTSKAKVVPPSSEVKTEAAAREVTAQNKATREKIDGLAKKMTHPARAKDEAVKAVTGKGKAKAAKAKAAKSRGAGNGSGPTKRLTMEWLSTKGKDVKVKDRVKAADGTVLDVIGRWTRKTKEGELVPMVTGHVISGPTASVAVEGKDKKVGDRLNAVAATSTHIKA